MGLLPKPCVSNGGTNLGVESVYSTMSSLHGVGSMATVRGRERFEKETTA